MKKTKRKGLTTQRVGTGIIITCAVLLAGLITLTVFFAIDVAKYDKVFGTVGLERDDKGRRAVTILYVVEGEAHLEPIDRAPRNWNDEQLVEIEYLRDDSSKIRVPVSVLPIVLGYFILAGILAAGILIRLGKLFSKETPE